MKMKSKILVVSLVATMGLAITYALFTTDFSVENSFKAGSGSAEFIEDFKSPKLDETVYGKTYEKSGKVTNTGSVPVIVQAEISYQWKNIDDDSNATIASGKLTSDVNQYAFTLDFGDTVDSASLDLFKQANANNFGIEGTSGTVADENVWSYDKDDDKFYYGGKTNPTKIDANESSSKLLKSVKFANELGKTTTITKYYILNGTDEVGKDGNPKSDTNYFLTQKDAMEYVDTHSNIITDFKGLRSYTKSSLVNTAFEGKYLVITIKGTVSEAV